MDRAYLVNVSEVLGVRSADAVSALLAGHARELYDDLRLVPLLRRLLLASCRLSDAAGGSISIVDPDRGQYTKIAERGTSCQLGQSFSLDEGVSGQVVRARRPVVLQRYRDIVSGHLPAGHPARDGAVAAIPIWWRGEVVGVNVVFAGTPRAFSTAEIDQLEVLTQLVSPGLVAAAKRDLSSTYFPAQAPLTEVAVPDVRRRVGTDELPRSVSQVALDLQTLADRAALERGDPVAWMHLAVAPSEVGLRLMVQTDTGGGSRLATSGWLTTACWQELIDQPDGGVVLQAATDAGIADLLDAAPPESSERVGEPCPFSPRERQVATLLACGLSDRDIADRLVISPKTVEKHVGAVLRKTGTMRRTAAVVRALAAGWLDEGPAEHLPTAN